MASNEELRPPTSYGAARKGTGPEIPAIVDGYYAAIVKDVSQTTATFQGETFEQYVVELEVLDKTNARGDAVTLRAYIKLPPTFLSDGVINENSNLYLWLKALNQDDNELAVYPEQWQGERVTIVVENREISSGKNMGQTRPRVIGYKPPQRAYAGPFDR